MITRQKKSLNKPRSQKSCSPCHTYSVFHNISYTNWTRQRTMNELWIFIYKSILSSIFTRKRWSSYLQLMARGAWLTYFSLPFPPSFSNAKITHLHNYSHWFVHQNLGSGHERKESLSQKREIKEQNSKKHVVKLLRNKMIV